MSVPAHRKSSSRTKRGRSHAALTPLNLGACPACKAVVKPHHACAKCGAYAGRSVK
ncbi:50S ribosomal protein L32 [Candidatus Uhrbacteria bacterium CG10_big_fil_rev_8_21_14_0_10_50_16]|uniref:Large ribosomal subunit protein bL32 n=1 Tax=Candidatus Uhrbacteria bacterium CG10_big_fil_rev_8_21_14_0_10_50_16 TaxID=1975039 RepID=A0A2H0RPK4_9BACT|nr:MAG: 50S ribosomal protein L32 [Candidatus Uhrbacteria bacterium CG10_big_fil_rev_8_21_14_0_10_50_16]